MRDRVPRIGQEDLPADHVQVLRQRTDATVFRAAMDLQQRAGNRSVAELVARSNARRDPNPLVALATAGRVPGAHAATPAGPASVQREPCVGCPESAKGAAPPELDGAAEPGQVG